MAATFTKRSPVGAKIRGVRVMLDPAKTARYPRLHAWFMKIEKVPHHEAISILIEAGNNVYTWELIDLVVPEKPERKLPCAKAAERASFSKQKRDSVLLAQNAWILRTREWAGNRIWWV